MADTIVNTTPSGSTDTSSNGAAAFLIGAAILALLAFFVFYYGLPAIRGAASPTVNVGVPDRVQVDVNSDQK